MKISERLLIRNFLTIQEFDWDVKDFNILTGGMGSGKSVCVKLLYFLESILHTLIFNQNITKENLNSSIFYDNIVNEFTKLFPVDNSILSSTEIDYTYSFNGNVFDLRAIWDIDGYSLKWSSNYLDIHLEKWQEYFRTEDTINMSQIVRNQIYRSISNDFDNSFPIGTIFIPASRAIAAITNNTDFPDPFLVNFIKNLKPFILRFKELSNKSINDILLIENMIYDKERDLRITLTNKCEIQPLSLSSGQQELLYLALLVGHLEDIGFTYAENISVFIEEPEAHLFPQDQKNAIEFIVKMFRKVKDQDYKQKRFFITTHSPYVLNVMSTMMNKGCLHMLLDKLQVNNNEVIDGILDKNELSQKTDFEKFFKKGEVSAYYINADDGKVIPMTSENDSFINAVKINDISQAIFDEANSVDDALAELNALEI